MGHRLELIAGPCVIESRDQTLRAAEAIQAVCRPLDLTLTFKSSFDKANRSSLDSYRGVAMEEGLEILAELKSSLGLPVLTDVHLPEQAAPVGEVVDVLQVPAFLCRQTDLLAAAAKTGKAVNVKKGQFLAPGDMRHVVTKLERNGAKEIYVTERGATFGYRTLVVDFRSLEQLKALNAKVVFDATHSVQLPGGLDGATGGERRFIAPLARAALAVGVDALFIEVHPEPDKAPCDGPNMLRLADLDSFLRQMLAVHACRQGLDVD